jgi:hypothetical protein
MSRVEYKNVGIEEFASRKQDEVQKSKLFAVPSGRVLPGDQVAGRVAEVLELELAQGSMPT